VTFSCIKQRDENLNRKVHAENYFSPFEGAKAVGLNYLYGTDKSVACIREPLQKGKAQYLDLLLLTSLDQLISTLKI
jgi:hypothetical protein